MEKWYDGDRGIFNPNLLQRITYFNATPPIRSYLVTIVISNFTDIPVKRINFQYRQQTVLHLKYAKDVIETVTLHLGYQWKYCRELLKVDHVVIPGFFYDRLNNIGLVLYR